MSEIHANKMDDLYSYFEQGLALAWAQAHLSVYMQETPSCTISEKSDYFLEAVEGGLSLALEFRKQNG